MICLRLTWSSVTIQLMILFKNASSENGSDFELGSVVAAAWAAIAALFGSWFFQPLAEHISVYSCSWKFSICLRSVDVLLWGENWKIIGVADGLSICCCLINIQKVGRQRIRVFKLYILANLANGLNISFLGSTQEEVVNVMGPDRATGLCRRNNGSHLCSLNGNNRCQNRDSRHSCVIIGGEMVIRNVSVNDLIRIRNNAGDLFLASYLSRHRSR